MDWRDKLSELAKANTEDFVHEANIIAGHGHTIPYLTMPPWLSEHKRRVYPKHLSYTYYNIGRRILRRGLVTSASAGSSTAAMPVCTSTYGMRAIASTWRPSSCVVQPKAR